MQYFLYYVVFWYSINFIRYDLISRLCIVYSVPLYPAMASHDTLTLLALGGGVFHVNFVCLLITFLVLGRLPSNLVNFHNWVLAKFSISKIKIDVSLLPW